MSEILEAITTGVVAFAATNIDDIFILILLYSQITKNLLHWHITAGQYLGFTALVAISFVGFLSGLFIPQEWIGFLGLLPIAIGIRYSLYKNKSKNNEEKPNISKTGALSAIISVAAVTIANGSDNIGIYAPLFASSDLSKLIIILIVFYVLLGVWCAVGYFLTHHPTIVKVLKQYSHYIIPLILVGLGIYILIESQTYRLFGISF